MRDSRLWSDLLVGLVVLGLGVYLTVADVTVLGPLRLVVAFVALLFVPGYAAAAALFPRPRDTDLVSRLALTLGLSVAAVPLTALLLNIVRWKITPGSTAVLLLLLTLALSAMALVRRLRAEDPQPYGLLRNRYSRRVLLAFAAVLAGILLVGSLTTGLRGQASYTEFYALGSQGRLERYPRQVSPGQAFNVTLGVLSQERTATGYTVRSSSCAPLTAVPRLSPGQRWQAALPCRVKAGVSRLEFTLYRAGSTEPYRTLSLSLQGAPQNQ